MIFTPVFFVLGLGLYQVYYAGFERKGADELPSWIGSATKRRILSRIRRRW